MKFGVRGKFFWLSVRIITVVILLGGIYLEVQLRSSMEQRIGTELNRHALTVREVLTNEASRPDLEDVQDFVTRFGNAIDARITLIREDGVVIGDSTLSMPGVQAMDNHAQMLVAPT